MRKGTRSTPEARQVNRLAQLKRWMPSEEFDRYIQAAGALKWCSGCKRLLTLVSFHKSKDKSDGLSSRCKGCSIASSEESRQKRLAQDPEGYRSLLNQRAAEARARAKANGRLQVTQRKQALRAYGLTLETFAVMLTGQHYRCAICRSPFRDAYDTHIDHDHACCPRGRRHTCGNCVRGILCSHCNTALGKFRDDPAILRRAARYIERDRARWSVAAPDGGQGILWDDSGAA
jgi:Recombination endonuclease VII